MRPFAHKSFQAFIVLLFLVGGVALVRDTVAQGQDFRVFWQSGQHLLHREPIYDVLRDGAMVFKYPPWIVPFFVPFSVLPLVAAKWAWALTELASLISVMHWLRKRGCSDLVIALTSVLFWGIFAVHFLDGQITLVMLAVALWGWEKARPSPVVFALSTKVFSGVSLLGWRRISAWQMGRVCVFLFVFTLPALWCAKSLHPLEFAKSWKTAAASGGQLFEHEKTRGRDNQGLPAVILRGLEVPSRDSRADGIAALICTLIIGGYWFFRSRQIRDFGAIEKWLGWLALGCVIHPLAWFHCFVLAYPLAALTLDQAVKSKDRILIFSALLSICMITVLTSKTLGDTGARLEFYSIKSFGVLFLMDMVLILERRRSTAIPVRNLKLIHSL
ncbi:MAG: DUF2029 domain-containing protein [Methylotenera sp.]|nr:DUF2029 domain-containing protein [Oligoflexia bacterium]